MLELLVHIGIMTEEFRNHDRVIHGWKTTWNLLDKRTLSMIKILSAGIVCMNMELSSGI